LHIIIARIGNQRRIRFCDIQILPMIRDGILLRCLPENIRNRGRILFCSVRFLFVIQAGVTAQSSPGPIGHFARALPVPGRELRVSLRITIGRIGNRRRIRFCDIRVLQCSPDVIGKKGRSLRDRLVI
jgi:hypothetical protein